MRSDKAWTTGIHKITTMSSVEGLPTQGSEIVILISNVHLHPVCLFVEFWGKFSEDRKAEYECLAKEIQSPGITFQEIEGNPGDQCLVQIDDTWHRSRIVSRNGSKYTVFLIDKGMTCQTMSRNLAWGKKNHFSLPPEVEHCVLANVLPFSPENRWSPVALDFLRSLVGKSVKAYVQDVLVQHRTFLLHINSISKLMYEMGIAKKLSPDKFQDIVHVSLQSHGGAEVSPETWEISTGVGERLRKEVFMYPELPEGAVESVIVTEVTNPQRMFCQLKVFSKELKKLSEQITKNYVDRMPNCILSPEMIGFPCAAKGRDGRWYRSVLQQIFPTYNVVEVLNVDYGTKQFVHVDNVRPLAAEFFRMPVVTYVCSLYGISEKGVGWTKSHIEYLRTLLLNQTVIAKFEYQSISEGVHYVTLYGNENTNINTLFCSKESCLLECDKTLDDYAIQGSAYSHKHPPQQERNLITCFTPGKAVEGKIGNRCVEKLQVEEISLSSSHVVIVQHVIDPSEFWIQTQSNTNEFDELTYNIYHLYKDSVDSDVSNPTVGLYCAAKAEDGDFYRATVTEVTGTRLKVLFVDYGKTEVVDRWDIRTLPDKFRKLPCRALKCTLAGVQPKDGKWSQSATEFFNSVATTRKLNAHVTAKCDESYAVQLSDPNLEGEKDLGTLMCRSSLAERAVSQRQAKMTTEPDILAPTQLPQTRLRNNQTSVQSLNTSGSFGDDRRIPSFKEHMFPIGSVLDVTVSNIESPNDFWCQLVQNAGHLKLLMHNLQNYYANSEFQPLLEMACVARHPHNGMWYRALVIHKHDTARVNVLFVDYGQTETVSMYDLRKICPEFLSLHGQAFRCSLLNPVDPTSATNKWTEEAIETFYSFVTTATSKFVILKCTIYAIMCSEQKIVFNIVDLETPFESVSTSMMNLVKGSPLMRVTGPSFRLDTYFYSTHNVKTGTEEEVIVTYVDSVSQFYCQLVRNSDVILDLKANVNNLCHQLMNTKPPPVFGTLCFAKHTDGRWYRGQMKATKPVILVHFVDYGETIEVEKSDLLPIPKEASDIMSVPVQAVLCSLSDVPVDVPTEVNTCFETKVTDCKFRALVVAREPDGKLLVELYHGKSQINSRLKKMFQIEMQAEKQIPHQGQKALEASANYALKAPKAVSKQAEDMKDDSQTTKKNVAAPKPTYQMKDGGMAMPTATKLLHHACENVQKVKAATLELYKPPHQRQPVETTSDTRNCSEEAGASQPRKGTLPIETKEQQNNVEKLPKLADLPSKCLTSGLEADVFVSHCNSPLSFYVQLVGEEDELFCLVEKLNDPESIPQNNEVMDLRPGDLVQAEFPDDSSWYRALVKEIYSNMMALVEFIDYGNTAMLPISKIAQLGKCFLQLPMYSTHCMLSDAAALGKEEVLDPKVMSAFEEDICGNGEKLLKCHFIRQSGSMWEVSLEDGGGNILCKIPTKSTNDDLAIISEKVEQTEEKPAENLDIRNMSEKSTLNSCSLCYHQQEFSDGQKLEVYVTTINDTASFWCQPADSEDFEKLTSIVSEVGNGDPKHVDPDSLSPGSPCIALYSDDHSWYRAEVIHKYEDKLSVIFVDYGNISYVSVTDVREIPSDLVETPSHAFLCELEGFDASFGSWDSGAIDELSLLTTDKVLQLTITRVTREEGKLKCFVHMECESQMINEAMKTWWNTITTEDKHDAVGSTLYEATLQCDSSLKDTTPPKDQLEYAEIQETDAAVACVQPQRDHSDEQGDGELVDLGTAEVPGLASSKSLKDYPHFESLLELPEEERDPIYSEDNMITETQTMMVSAGSGREEESMFPPLDRKGDKSVFTLSRDKIEMEPDEDIEEKDDSVMGTVGPDVLNTPLDETLVEALDASLPRGVNTHSVEHLSDPNEQSDEVSEVTMADDGFLSSMLMMTVVPHEEACPTDDISNNLKQIPTELMLTSTELFAFDALSEQEIEAGNGFLKEEVSCVMTHVQHDLIAEEIVDCYEEAHSVLLADAGTTARDAHTSTDDPQDLGDGVEEFTCGDEESCLTDLSTALVHGRANQAQTDDQNIIYMELVTDDDDGPDEPGGVSGVPSATDDGHLRKTAEGRHQNEQLLPCGDTLLEQLIDSQHSEMADSAQLVPTPSSQTEDFSNGEPKEGLSSSADDSFEAQLTNITHLSLTVCYPTNILPREL